MAVFPLSIEKRSDGKMKMPPRHLLLPGGGRDYVKYMHAALAGFIRGVGASLFGCLSLFSIHPTNRYVIMSASHIIYTHKE